MNLYLLRHGDALEQGYEDSARPLSAAGREQSALVSRTLKILGITPDAVLSSTLERARQTASIVCENLRLPAGAQTDLLVPGSDHLKLIAHLNALAGSSALLVGHEPHLSTLISILITGTTYSHIAVRKGTLLYLEGPSPLERGHSSLRWMFTPEEMRHLRA